MIKNKYARAYTEVLEIIRYFPDEEYDKIPKEKIEFYKNNMDKDYKFIINPEIDLVKQNISKEAAAIIVTIFRDYFATEEQKEKLEELIRLNEKKSEIEKREKYNPNNIFKKANKCENTNLRINENNNIELIEYKESFFTRFKNFILKILHINK